MKYTQGWRYKRSDPIGHGKGEHNKIKKREGTVHLNTDPKDKFDLKYPVNVREGKVSTGEVTVLLFIKQSDWKTRRHNMKM